jgi:hypothetical protein
VAERKGLERESLSENESSRRVRAETIVAIAGDRGFDPPPSSEESNANLMPTTSSLWPVQPVDRAVHGHAALSFVKGAADPAAGPDRLIPPAVQHRKQPFRARVQLLARLTLNPGKHTGNQPARLAQLDDGNDRGILVEGDEGPCSKPAPAQAGVIRLRHRGTPSVNAATKLPFPRRPPHRIFRSLSWIDRHLGIVAASDRAE